MSELARTLLLEKYIIQYKNKEIPLETFLDKYRDRLISVYKSLDVQEPLDDLFKDGLTDSICEFKKVVSDIYDLHHKGPRSMFLEYAEIIKQKSVLYQLSEEDENVLNSLVSIGIQLDKNTKQYTGIKLHALTILGILEAQEIVTKLYGHNKTVQWFISDGVFMPYEKVSYTEDKIIKSLEENIHNFYEAYIECLTPIENKYIKNDTLKDLLYFLKILPKIKSI